MKHQKVIKRKTKDRTIKIMYKNIQLKRFNHDHRPQVYMHVFVYVDPQTMPVGDHFTATKTFVLNYKKMSTPGLVPKNWMGFSYIRLEDYQLDQNFDDTELKKQSENTSNDKVKYFCETVVVLEEEWFDDITLTESATFPVALIKREKTRVNQKIKFPRCTKRRIR